MSQMLLYPLGMQECIKNIYCPSPLRGYSPLLGIDFNPGIIPCARCWEGIVQSIMPGFPSEIVKEGFPGEVPLWAEITVKWTKGRAESRRGLAGRNRHLPAVGSWTSYLIFLSLSFLFSKCVDHSSLRGKCDGTKVAPL